MEPKAMNRFLAMQKLFYAELGIGMLSQPTLRLERGKEKE